MLTLQTAQFLAKQYAPSLPAPNISYTASGEKDSKATELKLLFVIRKAKPALRQVNG